MYSPRSRKYRACKIHTRLINSQLRGPSIQQFRIVRFVQPEQGGIGCLRFLCSQPLPGITTPPPRQLLNLIVGSGLLAVNSMQASKEVEEVFEESWWTSSNIFDKGNWSLSTQILFTSHKHLGFLVHNVLLSRSAQFQLSRRGRICKGMNENKSTTRLRGVIYSSENEPYIKCVKHHLKPRIPEHGLVHRSLKFAVDPGDFACDPPEIIARAFNQGVDGSIGDRRVGEVKFNGG